MGQAKEKGYSFELCEGFSDEALPSQSTLDLRQRLAYVELEKIFSVKNQQYEQASIIREYEKELQIKSLMPPSFSFYQSEKIFMKIRNPIIGYKRSNDLILDYFIKILTQ